MLSQHLPDPTKECMTCWKVCLSEDNDSMSKQIPMWHFKAHELELIFTKPNPGGTGADTLLQVRKLKDCASLASLLFIFSFLASKTRGFLELSFLIVNSQSPSCLDLEKKNEDGAAPACNEVLYQSQVWCLILQ